MAARIIQIIAIAAMLSICFGSAEMIRLQKYTIDTGSFVMPVNYMIQEPEYLDGIYYEGLTWDIGRTSRDMIMIAKCDEPTDPRFIQYSLMSQTICNDTAHLNNSSIYQPVDNPYPGWLAQCQTKGTGSEVLVYAGAVNNSTILTFSSSEDPERVANILDNIRVILPEQVGSKPAANESSG